MPLKFIAKDDGSLDIEIYDVIGLWGLTVADFSAKLRALKGKAVNLRINSPGGSITEGLAIMSVIQRHDGPVTAYIDGVAASMAGVVAMAAKTIVMPRNSFIMIHDPSASISGTSEEFRKVADVLDKMGEMLISAYTRGGKVDRKKIEGMVTGESSSNEHWLTAEECLDLGLCDQVVEVVDAAAVSKHADYYPANLVAKATSIPPVIPTGGQQEQPNNMKKIIALISGLAATASEDEVAARVQETLNRVATLEQEKSTNATAHAQAIKDAKSAALQEATTAENKRKSAIKDFAAKYNKDGDLDEATVTALSGDTTLEAFKDTVLDIVAKRATKPALKPGANGSSGQDDEEVNTGKVASVEEFVKNYKACKSDRDRRILVRNNKVFAKQAIRNGSVAE